MPAPLEIFKTFLYIGATAFGGGGSAHIQNAVVARRAWLTPELVANTRDWPDFAPLRKRAR